MAKQRLIWIDALKGWLIILVVLGHSIQTELGVECHNSHVWNIIYSFHMPAFMAVSGWLFYKKTVYISSKSSSNDKSYQKSLIRRIYQLLLPFFIWSLLLLLLRGTYTIGAFVDIVYKPDKYFWFLWILFGISVIFSSVQVMSKKFKLNEMIAILITSLVLFGIMVLVDLRIFGFQFLAYYFIFYAIGYSIHKYEQELSYIRKPWIIFVLFGFWLILAWFWRMHELPSWIPFISYIPLSLQQYIYRGFTALLAVLILLLTAPSIMNGKNKLNRSISIIGDISLGIYVVHSIVIGYIKSGIHSVSLGNPNVNIMSIFTLSFISSLILVLLLGNNKFTSKFFLGKVS